MKTNSQFKWFAKKILRNVFFQEIEQKMFNKEPSSLKSSNRSQSMSSLAASNNAHRLKRTHLSKSSMSLNSPTRDIAESHVRNVKMPMSASESNDDDDDDTVTKTSEETSSDSEAAHSDGSSQTKQSSSDDSVQIRQLNDESSIKFQPNPEPRKRTAPTPQVRFSKLVSHIK